MTYNSRRFMSRVGFVFWTTDRIEEIVMWRKGWTHTLPWVIVYVLICYQPKLLLFVPNVVILCIMLITYQPSQNIPRSNGTRTTITDPSRSIRSHPPLPVPASEGSAAWLANVQGVQNLMGLVADAYDAAAPMVPYLTWRSRSSSILFLFALFLTISLWFIPLRLAFLSIGLFLFTATHPLVREALISPHAQLYFRQHGPFLWDRVRQFMNDAHLPERIIPHLNELRSVEVFQNERWAWPSSSAVSAAHGETLPAGWKNGAANLKPTERLPWTRGKDGSGGVGSASGVLNFSLEPHWAYVESEDWEPDFYGWWTAKDSVSRTDSDGWLYTNDAWLDPHRSPPAEWQKAGLMTRRRRWTRRIYYIGP
ncbi:Peroxin/Dysferlin domain-containing protein, partial [Cantharellus anzutake]|uniref:Peroxin/Dysferlin domain-containing protein n=1 Tax=Cantharellus anzutake TaxID=1750568 RepID=UPI001902C80A